MMRSLRTRLIIGTILAIVVVYGAATAAIFEIIRHSLRKELDSALLTQGMALELLAEYGEEGVKLETNVKQTGTAERDLLQGAFILQSLDGKVIKQSASTPPFEIGAAPEDGAHSFVYLRDGRRYRRQTIRFIPHLEDDENPPASPAPMVALTVYRDASNYFQRVAELEWWLGGLFAGATALTVVSMTVIVRRGLRPLQTLAGKIEGLGDSNLARVELPRAPSEIQPVVTRLNELLARLEQSFARERSFTADVAHELRTPLAGLTTALEVSSGQRRTTEEYQHVLKRCLDVSRNMRTMVENLLMLARADAGQLVVSPEPLDAAKVARELLNEYQPRIEVRGLHLEWDAAQNVPVYTDGTLLTIILRNLLDNATSYADAGGHVAVAFAQTADGLAITVANTGSEVAAEDAEKVFDRFWRGDISRNASGNHCGLGLSLCRRCAALLTGTLEICTVKGGRFVATLRIPPRLPFAT